MPTNYPGALDTTTQLPTNRADATPSATNHASDHDTAAGALLGLEAKVGTGSSAPTAGTYLVGTGPGASTWLPQGATAATFTVKDYGAVGNGSTDDTAAVQAAINAAAAAGGGAVTFGAGTYPISQITIPAVELQLLGNGAVILFHRGTAGTPMIINASSTVCPQFTLEDVTIDGNMGTYSASTGGGAGGPDIAANQGTVYTGGQPESTVTISLSFSNGGTFRNCRFQHSRHHAMDITGGSSRVLVENCTFTNMAEWGGTEGTDSTPLRFNGTTTSYEAAVIACSFEHPTPLRAGYNPGGLIVDVQGSNLPVRLNIDGCRFKNIGQTVVGTTVGNVYIYKAASGSSVTNCIFETPYFTPVAVENTSDFIIHGNRCLADGNLGAHVFSMQGNERSNNVQQFRVHFTNNTVSGTANIPSEAFYVDAGGAAGTYAATDVIISDNTVQNCRIGVRVSNTKGMIDIHDNQFRDLTESPYGQALWVNGSLTSCRGTVSFHDNYCENLNGNPVQCDDVANPGLNLRIESNTFNNTNSGGSNSGLTLRGMDEALIRGNKWVGTPTAGSIITLGGTNAVTRAIIDLNVAASLNTITQTNVTTVINRMNSWQ